GDASVPLLAPAASLKEATGLILASSYGSIPIAAALCGALRLVGSHVPHWIPFGHVLPRHPTAFAFLFDSATFVFSAAMIAWLPIRQKRSRGDIQLLRDV